jgi:hypothetical protein
MTNPRVFISHASEDKGRFVLQFAERLRKRGIEAWLDTWEILPGDNILDKVFKEGLNQSDAIIIVLSAVSITKPFVKKELNAAVVRSIYEQTRLIPIRLDECEIPECLRDGTLYQQIQDLTSYGAEFERIVNLLFGQYDLASGKPPLGDKPAYVEPDVLSIGDLTPIDSTIFEHACRIAIEQEDTVSISGEQMGNDLREQGISEAQIMETQDILEGRYYVEVHRVCGPLHVYDFTITTYGFGQFARVGVPDYGNLCADVAQCLVRQMQDGKNVSNVSVTETVKQPRIIVEHIIEELADLNLIRYQDEFGAGSRFMGVYSVSPELRRKLEGN